MSHINLQLLKHPCVPRINATWLWYRIPLKYYWILFASILLKMFSSLSMIKCSFLCSFFWNSLRTHDFFSLNVWQNLPIKAFGPGLLFVGRFLNYWFNFIMGNWSVHIFHFFLVHSVLGDCTFLGIFSRFSTFLSYNCV